MIELAPRHKRGLGLANPVMNASGCLGFGPEYRRLIPLASLGAFVTNALTRAPRTPARPPNVLWVEAGLLVHTGLPNPGLRTAVRRHARDWARLGTPVIVHLAVDAPADVGRALEVLERLDDVAAVELGWRDDVEARDLAAGVRAAAGSLPVLARLPLERAVELAPLAADSGADALTVAAPARGWALLGEVTIRGRLYGPGQQAAALQALEAITRLGLETPLVAAGGIFSVGAARAMLEAGACAVQVDAAAWSDPGIFSQLIEALV